MTDKSAGNEHWADEAQYELANNWIGTQLRLANASSAYAPEATPVYLREIYFKASRTAFLASIANEWLKRISAALALIAVLLVALLWKSFF